MKETPTMDNLRTRTLITARLNPETDHLPAILAGVFMDAQSLHDLPNGALDRTHGRDYDGSAEDDTYGWGLTDENKRAWVACVQEAAHLSGILGANAEGATCSLAADAWVDDNEVARDEVLQVTCILRDALRIERASVCLDACSDGTGMQVSISLNDAVTPSQSTLFLTSVFHI